MSWKPLHPDERMAHERQRQSLLGRSRRFGRLLRYHPLHALRSIAPPLTLVALTLVAIGIIAVFAAT